MTSLNAGNASCLSGGAAVVSATGTAYVCNGSSGSAAQVQPMIANVATFQSVNGWAGLSSNQAWTLCYKATRDNVKAGFIAYPGGIEFHARCDNRGATFFVAKTAEGRRFGGYTALAWTGGSGDCNWHNDSSAFLFSLTNNFKHEQTGPDAGISTYDCNTAGPTFGAANDFYTDLSTYSYVDLGSSYACRVGDAGSEECRNDFAGGYNPVMIELEVYAAQ